MAGIEHEPDLSGHRRTDTTGKGRRTPHPARNCDKRPIERQGSHTDILKVDIVLIATKVLC